MDLPLPELMEAENVTTKHMWLNIPVEVLSLYNSYDTYTTARLRLVQEEELRRAQQLEFHAKWFDIVPVAIAMQKRGFGQINRETHDRVREEMEQELLQVQSEIMKVCDVFQRMQKESDDKYEADKLAHPTWVKKLEIQRRARERKIQEGKLSFFRPTSKLMRAWLFDQLKIRPAPKTKKRPARSLAAESIDYIISKLRVLDQPYRFVLENMVHIGKLNTVLDRYFDPPNRGGRLYPKIKLYSAETLRWAYGDPALQQWPPKMRKMVHARPGYVFVARDYSQIEAGIQAIVAGDEQELAAFLDPTRDLHIEMACDGLGIRFDTRPDIPPEVRYRQWFLEPEDRRKVLRSTFKTTRYERQYGGAGLRSKGKAGCPCARCRKEATGTDSTPALSPRELAQAIARWDAKHKKVRDFREQLVQTIQASGNSWVSPFGYRRVWCGPSEVWQRPALNFPMQHSVAMIINRAMIELHRRGVPLVLQMHDELVAEVPASEAESTLSVMKEVMEQPVPELGGVCFPTEGKVAEIWADLK